MCRVLRVNRSTYYKHFYSNPAPRTTENQKLKSIILHIYAEYDKRLGAYKTATVLERDYGISISVGRVYRLMKSMSLPKMSTVKPSMAFVRDEEKKTNYLEQHFEQKAPNLVWVSDITYLKAGGKWYYLCVIIDLFARKVIAWDISAKPDTDLVISVFERAYANRHISSGLMFHSDRGTQYTSFKFRKLLDERNVVQSFSKKGYPFDNAVAESFFKYLKKEETNRRSYSSFSELKLSLFQYIEGFYNSKRPHSSIAYLTPHQKELDFYSCS